MSWNYRVFVRIENDMPVYSIKETYYNDQTGAIEANTMDDIAPIGNSLEDLKDELTNMLEALEKPILDEKEID